MDKERWAAAVDCVGGDTLAYVVSTLRAHGAVAASGNTGGAVLSTTVFPFILRGVALLGVDSAYCAMDLRRQIWTRMAGDLAVPDVESIVADEVDLEGLADALARVLAGGNRGRTLVNVSR
jgi:NADPH:quinone reductase-like Zn-dependent oxidoreductase